MSMQSLAQPPRYYNPSHVPNKIARLKSMAPKENFRRLRRTHKELQDINLNLALDLYIWSLEYKVSHTAMDELLSILNKHQLYLTNNVIFCNDRPLYIETQILTAKNVSN